MISIAIHCDDCPRVFAVGCSDGNTVIGDAKADGWFIGTDRKRYDDLCPQCLRRRVDHLQGMEKGMGRRVIT